MATYTNDIVTTRAAGTISRPNEYMGIPKIIPVSVTIGTAIADADVLVLSEVLGQNSKIVNFNLTNTDLGTAATLSLTAGAGGTALGTISGTTAGTTTYLLAPVDVSDTQIIATASSVTSGATGTLVGTITVVNDW